MKIAVQLHLLPGGDPAHQARWAADHGVDGIELAVWTVRSFDALRHQAETVMPYLPISSVCGNVSPDWERSFDFVDPDPAKRRASIDGSKRLLAFCSDVGAVGQIVPPIFGSPVVPDLSPVMSVPQLEDALMVAALQELGPFAADRSTRLLVEPLNRYEQHYLCRLADGVRVLNAARVGGTGLLADLFHMHIEETDSPAALRAAGSHVMHVHVADNTRMEPGTGDIDFQATLGALRHIGFDGYLAYECDVSGDDEAAKARNLAASLAWLRRLVETRS